MKHFSVVEAKAHFSMLLAQVEAGEEVAVTRHGRVVARLSPERVRNAREALADLCDGAQAADWQEAADVPPDAVAWED